MNVVSLELSQKLYKLSGWHDRQLQWYYEKSTKRAGGIFSEGPICPQYDLGYLLRKFAEKDHYISVSYVDYVKMATDLREWRNSFIAYTPWMKQKDYPVAQTPEDATAKLAVELFKQGILVKETKDV